MQTHLQKPCRAVTYIRVSTDEQAQHGTSLESQLAACRKKAEEMGAQIVKECQDAGVSGALFTMRPGIQEVLELIESGRADTLITYDLTRLSRDSEHHRMIDRRLTVVGAKTVFCTINFDNTAEGSLAKGIMSDLAAYERRKIRERMVDGRKQAARNGRQPVRTTPPFGYRIVTKKDVIAGRDPEGTEGTYVIVEERAKWVRQMFGRYAAGDSLRKVCRWLHENGVPTAKGGAFWRPEGLTNILKNTVYKGQATFGKRITLHDESLIEKGFRRTFKNRITPEEQHITIKTPPLVDDETWQKCQENFARNKEVISGNPRRSYLLTGLIRCPQCNRTLRTHPYTKMFGEKREGHVYHCQDVRASRNLIGHVCDPSYYQGQQTEQTILCAIVEVAHRPEYVEAALAAYANVQAEQPQDSIEELREQLELLQKREKAVVTAQITGVQAGADPGIYIDIFKTIHEERETLMDRLQAAEAQRQRTPARQTKNDAQILSEMLSATITVLLAPEDHLAIADKRNLLSKVIDAIYPRGEEFLINLKPPTKETVGTITSVHAPRSGFTSPPGYAIV